MITTVDCYTICDAKILVLLRHKSLLRSYFVYLVKFLLHFKLPCLLIFYELRSLRILGNVKTISNIRFGRSKKECFR